MIMLGAFTRKSNLVSPSSLIDGLKDTLKNKQKLISINEKALMAGYDMVPTG
jgi:Pyruvate/2-oxoacid:ferredoxin oxidoreductase gamma subunit